jgi:RTX calcium-binding nonapeptide repeat (4 copies)
VTNQFVLESLNFKSSLDAYSTSASFDQAVLAVQGMTDATADSLTDIQTALRATGDSELISKADDAQVAATTMRQLKSSAAGMFFVHDPEGNARFPVSFDDFLAQYPTPSNVHPTAEEYFRDAYGITRESYSDIRTEYIMLNNAALTWATNSTTTSAALQNYYSSTFTLAEAIDVADTVLDVVDLLTGLRAARTIAEGALAIGKGLFSLSTGLPTSGTDFVKNVVGETIKNGPWINPSTALIDEFQTSAGIRFIFTDGDGPFASGFIGDTLFVSSASSGAAVNFDLGSVRDWRGVETAVVVGSEQADKVTMSILPLGVARVLTGGGSDEIEIGKSGALSPTKVVVDAGDGTNTVYVQAGQIEIKSGRDADSITVGFGGDFKVDAGGGNDNIIVGNVENGLIIGGEGEDTVDYSGDDSIQPGLQGEGIKVDFSAQGPGTTVRIGELGTSHILVGVEKVILTQFADEVQGNNQVNKFEGLGGDDILTGGGGADTLDGGADDDTVDYSKESGGGIKITLGGGNNISVVDGSGSTDTLISIEKVIGTSKEDKLTLNTLQTDIELDLGEGNDTIDLTNAGSGVTVDLYSDKVGSLEILNAEHIIGTTGADDITGNDENNRIVGGGGIDEIDGGGSDDIIYNGDDKGSDDNAKETLNGGDGDDTYYVGVGDTINDSDGMGRVFYDGNMLSGGIHPYWDWNGSPMNTGVHHCSN